MSNISSVATVTVRINGQEAANELNRLRGLAANLRAEIDKANKAGDKKKAAQLTRELRRIEGNIREIESATMSVADVLSQLDKASPKELRKTLKTLEKQLNNMVRGTEEWAQQTERIRLVRAELSRVNSELRGQDSLWERFNRKLNDYQTAFAGIIAAVVGIVAAGRKAVSMYADIEQEMANVIKYTGMSEDQVVALNEEFKKFDTRTTREDLNKLAQEAGRLGKTSKEDILGFVRAAYKINVALDDLGEGATLTLSKLAQIFGDEERLGTEKALISIGSVINELSQNCAASAPYLTEFASRLGGVGAQAGLTIQQIMGIAAVLDSKGQKVEASATAVAQVLTRMYQDPAKYARAAGLEIKNFSDLVRSDANEALMVLSETLNSKGGLKETAPIFKEMGENGSRAVAALATIAENIKEVRSQQMAANVAFDEATSIENEFNVQNNTVKAGLEKAKKRLDEIAISLGQKLMPVMEHVIKSSTLTLKILEASIDFIAKNKREVIAVTAALAGYALTLLVVNTRTAMAAKLTALFNGALAIAKGAIPAVRLVLVALANAVQFFTNGLEVNYAMQERWRNALGKMKLANWVGLILTAATAIYLLASRFADARKKAKEAAEEFANFQMSIVDISKQTADAAAKEKSRLDDLYSAATEEAKSKDERVKAANKLIELYPDYFGKMSAEQIMLGQTREQYDKLTESIVEMARAKAAAAKIEENQSALLELEEQESGLRDKYNNAKVAADRAEADWRRQQELAEIENKAAGSPIDAVISSVFGNSARSDMANLGAAYESAKSELEANLNKQKALRDAIESLRSKYGVAAEHFKVETIGFGDGGDGDGDSNKDRFRAEKEWRAMQEARARIDYAIGESDYIEHSKRMLEIEQQYYKKILEHSDLSELERAENLASLREAEAKERKQFLSMSVDQESQWHNEALAQTKQFYLDGKIDKSAYDSEIERLEILHQKFLVELYDDGSKEKAEAEDRLNQLLLAQKLRRAKEFEDAEKKHADEIRKIKDSYFGLNKSEAEGELAREIELLDEVYALELASTADNSAEKLRIEEAYQKARLAISEKYSVLRQEEEVNAFKAASAKVTEWLKSDEGKAFVGALDTMVSSMSAIFSQLSESIKAEIEIQKAAIESRYDAELKRAQGNSYKVAALERKKEAEIASIKNSGNAKLYNMQIFQAVAQTAQAAINAYSSAAAIPMVGYVLAPIAAAAAIAAGSLQVANIKKQQALSLANGYSSGGYTKKGPKDEPAGIVHAGEWVASQKLVNNPATSQVIKALDFAQRTNNIGAFRTGSEHLIAQSVRTREAERAAAPIVIAADDDKSTAAAIEKLVKRLNEPFVTVNTIVGEKGIKKAWDSYDQLMKNKSRK